MSRTPSTTRSSLPQLPNLGLRIRLRSLHLDFVSSASPQVFNNSGSSLRLLDYCFGRSSSDLEVIASAFLGTSLIINAANSLSNIAEIPNENHLIVQLAQYFAYQSVAFLCVIAQKALFICILDYINETDQKWK